MVSAVLFDLVGTLVKESSDVLNTEQGYYGIQVKAIHHSLEEDGVGVDWHAFKNNYEQVRTRQREQSNQTLREYDMCKRVSDTLSLLKYDVPSTSPIVRRAVDAYMNIYIDTLQINQSTYGILETLFSKYRLGLVTNFAYPPGVYRILDQFALRPFFKTVVVSGETGWKKPSPCIFDIAISQMSVKPNEMVFVGDSYETDIIGAKNAGLKTIFLCKEHADNKKKTDCTIRSLKELPSAVEYLQNDNV